MPFNKIKETNKKIGKKQSQILQFIIDSIKEFGYPPTIREIANAVNLKSSATVHNHLNKLENLGYLRRTKGSSRTIEIINPDFEIQEYIINNSKIKENINNKNNHILNNIIMVPVIGNVSAGAPILAQENIEDYIPFTSDFIKDHNSVFILKVKGDSMINAGILDRDYIIVKKQDIVRNGEIVVALIEDEVTVKRFLKTDKLIKLIPENDFMKPIVLKEVKILGKVIGVLRKYF